MDSNGLWVSPYLWAPHGVLPAHPAQRDVTLLQFWVHLPLHLCPANSKMFKKDLHALRAQVD